ncbi:MAG: aldo/keto reductase [Rhodobacteraceae bacterium]|nr:aldo/keto reductase [Paracoccaceae bacterium]
MTQIAPRRLGPAGPLVSPWCLGTMTFGTQTDPATAHAQIDAALAAGVTFLDTAEMYPTNPATAETVGRTEQIIGDWLRGGGDRDRLTIATKMTGPGRMVRPGRPPDGAAMREAVEGSLRRLGLERIDLYQIHWPARGSYHFRQMWGFDATTQQREETRAHMADLLQTAGALVREGKIAHFGLSNESAWGLTTWTRIAEATGSPRPVSVQNEYSLLCRIADTDMAEALHHEGARMLAYSPLASGLLSGKYAGDVTPENSRRAVNPALNGRITPRVWEAVSAYLGIAQRHGLDPVHMALAFVRDRPFMGAVIFGASTLEQLEHILAGLHVTLDDEVRAEIDAAHKLHPLPF